MTDFAPLFPTVEPLRRKAAAFWQARSRREQWLLGGLIVALLLWALVVGLVQPLRETRAQALADIRHYERLSARLRTAGPLDRVPATPPAQGDPASILSAGAARFGLAAVVDPDPRGGARVVIADAPYESLIRWIAEVERTSPLRVVRLRVERRPARGFVSAELMVRG